MCQRSVAWIQRHGPHAGIDYVTCQSAERANRFPAMSEQQCLEAIQFVNEDGKVFSAEAALAQVLKRIPRWRWLGNVLNAPGIRHIAPFGYRYVARRRYAISGFLARKSCEETGCRIEGDQS
jgi:predicted DCC family thiol-disulfide oxidoreductase YuxK